MVQIATSKQPYSWGLRLAVPPRPKAIFILRPVLKTQYCHLKALEWRNKAPSKISNWPSETTDWIILFCSETYLFRQLFMSIVHAEIVNTVNKHLYCKHTEKDGG